MKTERIEPDYTNEPFYKNGDERIQTPCRKIGGDHGKVIHIPVNNRSATACSGVQFLLLQNCRTDHTLLAKHRRPLGTWAPLIIGVRGRISIYVHVNSRFATTLSGA